jgi:hypothetical protein
MVGGTFKVETSDDTRFVVGETYPLTIDATVQLDVVESVTATVAPAPVITPPVSEPALPVASSAGSTPATA